MPTEQETQDDSAVASAPAAKTPKTCTICERPLPCPLHDAPVPALDALSDERPVSKALIEEAPVTAPAEVAVDEPRTLDELHARIVALRQPPPVYVPPPPTPRQAENTRLEMEAGKRASERAAAQQARRPVQQTDRTEGTNTPVFRPGDVDEYRNSFRSPGQTTSKDAK